MRVSTSGQVAGVAPCAFSSFISCPLSSFSVLVILSLLLTLTGFVCTYKIQAEEECLSSNIPCYECDSRVDANCADPFDLSSEALSDSTPKGNNVTNRQQQPNETNTTLAQLKPKRWPPTAMCHGCCVKITSKTLEGVPYFKRTCTTNLQINFFMVGLVCMKESGDRGKMCFCESDYCNGQPSDHQPQFKLIALLVTFSIMKLSLSYH